MWYIEYRGCKVRWNKLFNIYVSVAISLFLISADQVTSQNREDIAMSNSNQIVLGGLFPLRSKREDTELECGKEINMVDIQQSHTMLYAIAKVNEDDKILPNITLRAKIYDTCRSQTIAASRTREFIKMTIVQEPGAQLAGVVGASVSDVSAKVASVLQVFEIPQISYESTSVLLSDRDLYSYFLRTVPPDSFQAKAMVDICLNFGWTYVFTINSDGIYGKRGIEQFHKFAREKGICTDHIGSLKRLTKGKDYVEIVEKLVEKSKGTSVSVVVLFCTIGHSYGITREAQKNMEAMSFTWIVSDAYDTTKLDLSINASLLTVKLGSSEVPQDFKDYFKALNPMNYQWQDDECLQDLWRQLFRCESTNTSTTNLTKCTGKESLKSKTFGFTPQTAVTNAVYAFAHALDHLQRELCPNQLGICPVMREFKRKRLFDHLKNVSFLDSANDTFQFNENGEVTGRYDILNFQAHNSQVSYVRVGTWHSGGESVEGGLVMNHRDVKWQGGKATAPSSYCSLNCSFGDVKHSMFTYDFTCCWTCHRCEELNIIVNNTCLAGPVGYIPNANRTKWMKREVLYLKWSDRTSVILITISLLSIFFTLLTLLVFCVFRNNRVLKASGRELCLVILIGILLCFLTPFLYIAKPNNVICYARRLSTGLALTMCYAALFMKINRVYRVFSSAKRSIQRPPLVRPNSQILVTIGLTSIQVLVTGFWFMADPVRATETYYSEEERLILECKFDPLHFLASLSYVLVLMLLCTVYAFKTRKFPKNFNESKYIGFTLYTTCTVYVIFLAFFLNTKDNITVDIVIAGFTVFLGLVTLLGLFAQKISIVILAKGVIGVEDDVGMAQTSTHSNYNPFDDITYREGEQQSPKNKHIKNCTVVEKRVKRYPKRSESF